MPVIHSKFMFCIMQNITYSFYLHTQAQTSVKHYMVIFEMTVTFIIQVKSSVNITVKQHSGYVCHPGKVMHISTIRPWMLLDSKLNVHYIKHCQSNGYAIIPGIILYLSSNLSYYSLSFFIWDGSIHLLSLSLFLHPFFTHTQAIFSSGFKVDMMLPHCHTELTTADHCRWQDRSPVHTGKEDTERSKGWCRKLWNEMK